jgi:hypothetical protein
MGRQAGAGSRVAGMVRAPGHGGLELAGQAEEATSPAEQLADSRADHYIDGDFAGVPSRYDTDVTALGVWSAGQCRPFSAAPQVVHQIGPPAARWGGDSSQAARSHRL